MNFSDDLHIPYQNIHPQSYELDKKNLMHNVLFVFNLTNKSAEGLLFELG